jgi:hypothetical protein
LDLNDAVSLLEKLVPMGVVDGNLEYMLDCKSFHIVAVVYLALSSIWVRAGAFEGWNLVSQSHKLTAEDLRPRLLRSDVGVCEL